ncbi:MAG: hypothetical protein ACI9OU_001239 [Candidatus Promineifilaceae bacterium]|jgi:hypothetical protein
MTRLSIVTLLLLLMSPRGVQAQEPVLMPLFNGKDFSAWQEPKDNIWWTIKDEILTAQSDPQKHGSILWTTATYQNFVIQLDFRFGEGTVDSGVFLRTENQQIQIGISGSKKRDMTCSPYIPGKGYPVEAEGIEALLKPDDWNTIRIKADAMVYSVWLNGEQVLTYESPSAIVQGPIGLQLHPGKKMRIDFRNITFAELPATPTKTE